VERSLRGKTALVTGTQAGIGKQTAIDLAELGAAVVLVAPAGAQSAVVKQEVSRESGSEAVDVLDGDLAVQRDVHYVAEQFRARHDRLDLLVHTACARYEQREVTEDGVERTLATNFLSTFLLTSLLLDELRAGAPSRVLTVSSSAHRHVSLDFDDLQGERAYDASRAYAQSKLATILFTYELAGRLDGSGVTVNCVTPGTAGTERGSTRPATFSWGARRASRALLRVAAAPDLETVSAECFSRRGAEKRTSADTYDPAIAASLWEATERLVGVMVG
jgi:NAD(P)-dependent dehydrogenase (short-subunit alcohol dehydrogenase family)